MADIMLDMPQQSPVVATAPQAEVILSAGIPWTNDYNHVRLFASAGELESFVKSKQVARWTQSTPVRWGEVSYRAKGNESALIEANYIMFKNAPFNSKWYYGFVTGIQWLSNGSCVINIEPDYWQNNIYEVSINKCFVEREHVSKAADVLFGNLVPEGLEAGEYKAQERYAPIEGGWLYSLLASATSEGQQPIPVLDNNIFSGLSRYNAQNYRELITILNNFQNSGIADAVVQIYQYPAMCDRSDLKNQQILIPIPSNIDGYVPKNNKLFQYPYIYVLFSNPSNKTATFRFELTNRSDHGIDMRVSGMGGLTPMIHILPNDYRVDDIVNYFDDIYVDATIQCAWTNDAYQAYLAQMSPVWQAQEKTLAVQQIGTAFNGIMATLGGLATGNIFGGLTSGANAVFNTATAPYLQQTNIQAQKESHDLIPPSSRGSVSGNSSVAMFSTNIANFYTMTITAQMARCIDDYFTAFGYATNRLKVPNINSRSSWNFVKTNGATFSGAIMLDDMRKLQAIFDRGVTIWHTNDVGNYSLENN